jgi:hypothetical protein
VGEWLDSFRVNPLSSPRALWDDRRALDAIIAIAFHRIFIKDFVEVIVAGDRSAYDLPVFRTKLCSRLQLPRIARARADSNMRMIHIRLDGMNIVAGLKEYLQHGRWRMN